jgi:hypothetical protein
MATLVIVNLSLQGNLDHKIPIQSNIRDNLITPLIILTLKIVPLNWKAKIKVNKIVLVMERTRKFQSTAITVVTIRRQQGNSFQDFVKMSKKNSLLIWLNSDENGVNQYFK